MGTRHPNPRLAKLHRTYSVEEVARLFKLHKNTVRNWLKQGLTPIDDRRPILILGKELSRFLQERRHKAKQVCGPGRIYCSLPSAKGPGWKHGRMHDYERLHWQPLWRLPRV